MIAATHDENPTGLTGYVYDSLFQEHDQAGHDEHAGRLAAVMNELRGTGLLDRLQMLPGRPALPEELSMVHTRTYQGQVAEISAAGGGLLDVDTYTTGATSDAATLAAGSVLALTQAVAAGQLANGIALVRPPGHHALPDRAMGFCIFGNAALAARLAFPEEPDRRVAVVDFDVHHGNGTQAMLEENPHKLFISSHQYPHYPGTGAVEEIGQGPGLGATLNLPLPAGVGDAGFQRLYEGIVAPALRRFAPDLIVVSAGFDAHWADPLAQLNLTLSGQAWLARFLIALSEELCNGKIVFTLEGGYNLEALSHGVANTVRALLGDTEITDPLGPATSSEPDLSALEAELRGVHSL